MLSRDNEATVLTASAIAKASTGARGIPSFRLLFRWEIAAIVGKVVISVWRVGGRVWTTTSFIYWTARAGQQGRRELRHLGMMQQLWLKRGRRLATRRSRFGRATAVWRRCCICRGSPELSSPLHHVKGRERLRVEGKEKAPILAGALRHWRPMI